MIWPRCRTCLPLIVVGINRGQHPIDMNASRYLKLTGTALKHWFIAQCEDALVVGILGCWGFTLKVPWAPVWATLASPSAIHPALGPRAGNNWADANRCACLERLAAPTLRVDALRRDCGGGWFRAPALFMKRTAKVPMWASILAPIALSFLIPFWGILLAPPLLVVIYAFRRNRRARGANSHREHKSHET